MNTYENLIERLDAFVRKYYANQLLRGVLVLLIGLLAYILVLSLGEYFLYLPVWLKMILVTLFLLATTAALLFWIVLPLAKMAKLGKIISHENAAEIIGKHFPEVSDKLLNILQLKQQTSSAASQQLIEASIGQKINKLSVVPIGNAIDFKSNKKYLKFLLPLILIGTFILVAAPNVFRDASQRLLQPNKEFVKPTPFQFTIISEPLQVVRNADYTLKVQMSGNALPANVFLAIGDEKLPMQAAKNHSFEYTFKNCTELINFRFYAASFYSEKYQLKILQRPILASIAINIHYPSYTGRKDEIKNGLSDMTLPIGTTVNWQIGTQYADVVKMKMGDSKGVSLTLEDKQWVYNFRFLQDTSYSFELQNLKSKVDELLHYKVQVIQDAYPTIQMQSFKDSTSGTQVVLNGTVGDDYGVSRVAFQYLILDEKNKILRQKSIPIMGASGTVASFQHYFDIASVSLVQGEQLNYFVEVWDNDGVHGSKSSRSETLSYKAFDTKQIDSALNKNAQQINSGLSNSAKQNEQIQDQMQSLQSKMLKSEQIDWQQNQGLQDIAKLQEKMKNNLEQIKKRFDEQMKQSEQKNLSEDLKEKQDAVKEQLDNLLNKELKEQMKKLQELLQKLNKEQTVQQMQQMQEENKLFTMDMERLQALMKKLEMQMKMENLAAKMQDLANKQTELRKETDEAKQDNKSLEKKQEELKKELQDALKKDLQEMKVAGKEIPQKTDLKKEEQQGEQAEKEMQKSENQLDKNENNKASESQSKAAQNLQDMANSISAKAGGMSPEQIEMDIKAVRQVLTNLMRLSFDQEQLIGSVKTTPSNNPKYLTNMESQNGLHANSLVIRDSLFSLSKRLVKLSASVNKETNELEKNMRRALTSLEQRNSPDAATRQQYVMTHTNNLALMLNEILSNLMQQQSQKGGGKGQCNNPGGSTPKPGAGKQLSDIISKQKGLGQSMKKGEDGPPKEGEKGKKGKDGKEGENGKQGKQGEGNENGGSDGNAKELVQMAQQQAAIRRQLAELNSLLNSQGNNNIAKDLKEIQDKMDKNESDLVNRKLDGDFYMRQKEILSRMMETEKSLREQEQDDKRSSKNPEEISRAIPPELAPFLKENKEMKEQYKTIPPTLKPYYKELNEKYFKQVAQ